MYLYFFLINSLLPSDFNQLLSRRGQFLSCRSVNIQFLPGGVAPLGPPQGRCPLTPPGPMQPLDPGVFRVFFIMPFTSLFFNWCPCNCNQGLESAEGVTLFPTMYCNSSLGILKLTPAGAMFLNLLFYHKYILINIAFLISLTSF